MSAVNLIDPIAAYFAAEPQGAEAISRCFTSDARVCDEGKAHIGLAAIRAWSAQSAARYRYTLEPRAVKLAGHLHKVQTHVIGDFPGSPIDLTFSFRVQHGLIAELEIAV